MTGVAYLLLQCGPAAVYSVQVRGALVGELLQTSSALHRGRVRGDFAKKESRFLVASGSRRGQRQRLGSDHAVEV